MGVPLNHTRFRAPFNVALSAMLVLTMITVVAVPLAVEGGNSGDRAGLAITMTGETEHIEFELSIVSGEGGAVEVPGEGVFPYDAGTVVELEAVPDYGFYFAGWTGNVATIADVTSGLTSIVMDDDYRIEATYDSVALPARPGFPWWWVLVGIVIAGLLVYFLWWRRRRRTTYSPDTSDRAGSQA